MRKHVSTTMLTYLAAVMQDASKSCVAFLLLCTIVCKMRAHRPQAYVPIPHSCTFMFMFQFDMIAQLYVWRPTFYFYILGSMFNRRLVSAPSNCADNATYEVTDPEPEPEL